MSLEGSVNLDQKVPIQAPDALTSGSSQDPEQEETRKAPVKAFGWISGNIPCTTGFPKYEKGRRTGAPEWAPVEIFQEEGLPDLLTRV